MTREHQQLRAIEAISGGRLDEATAILLVLSQGPRPLQSGICRYCHCSEASGCAIVVASADASSGFVIEPYVVRCSWANAERTVCTSVHCLEAWRRDAPAETQIDVTEGSAAAAPQSRVVRP